MQTDPPAVPPAPTTSPPPPPPRRRRRWLRRILKVVVVLAVLVALAPFALSIAPVRRLVAQRVSNAVGRRVTIGGITARWWSGIEMRDVEVHNPEGFDGVGPPLLAVDRVHVDVAVVKAVFGAIDADVEVFRPAVTLLRTPSGARNTDGLMREGEEKDKKEKRAGGPTVAVRVTEGRILSHDAAGGRPPDSVEGLTATLRMDGGALRATLHAIVKGAGRGGADVPVDAVADLDAHQTGRVTVQVPAIDLSRVAALVEAATGASGLSGEAQASAAIELDGTGWPKGKAEVRLDRIAARMRGGDVRLRLARATWSSVLDGSQTRMAVEVVAEDFAAKGFSNRDAGLVEPRLRIAGTAVGKDRTSLSFGDAATPFRIEGRSISGSASGGLSGLGGENAASDLKADLSATLSPTLARLAGFLDSPDDDLRGEVKATLAVTGTGGRLAFTAQGTVRDLTVGGGAGSTPYTEPVVEIGARGTWDGGAGVLALEKTTRLSAGAVKISVPTGLEVSGLGAGTPRAKGRLDLDADLLHLARLKSVVPLFRDVWGGTVSARVTPEEGGPPGESRFAWVVTARGLAFGSGRLSSAGYREPEAVVQGRFVLEEGGTAAVSLASLSSSLATVAQSPTPATARFGKDGTTFSGSLRARVDLAPVGRAFDRLLGLSPGEAVSGRLEVTAAATGNAWDVTLSGRDLQWPRSFGGGGAPGALDGKARVRLPRAGAGLAVEDAVLAGYGLDVRGHASFSAAGADGESSLQLAHAQAKGDLASARPLLAPFLGLEAGGALEGRVDAVTDLAAQGAGRRFTARATVSGLRYGGGAGREPLEDASVLLEADVLLDAPEGTHRVERMSLRSSTVNVSVAKGILVRRGEDLSVDAEASLDGDAKVLAKNLRSMLGEGHEDLDGEGRVTGKAVLVGVLAGARDLRLDGDFAFRRFASGGLSLENGRVTAKRPTSSAPLVVTAQAAVNGGTLRADATCDLGRDARPWSGKAALRGIDTSPLVTGKGFSRYLPMILPAIVPAGKATPVLSGRLDGDLDLASASLSDPGLSDGLTGSGSVRMTQGTVADSSLFSALSGEGQGKALALLGKVVPAAGKWLSSLGGAVLFTDLSSRFEVGQRRIHLLEVKMTAPSYSLAFDGWVGFDGRLDLKVPLKVGGDVGQAIGKYVKNSTIPLKVTGTSSSPKVRPDLDIGSLSPGGLLDGLLPGRK